jgi:hypothetical protein
MKKNISWQVLIIIGLVGDLIGRFTVGIIGDAIGVVGDICLLIGIANMLVAWIKNKKFKKEQATDTVASNKIEARESFSYKKYAKYIPYAVISILIIVIILLVNNREKTNSFDWNKGNEVPLITGDKRDSWDSVNMVDKYGAEVLQIGGIGSRITQRTAYLITEHGYLKPPEDWVVSSFNGPADIMDVDCRNGYTIISCNVNDRVTKIDAMFGCRAIPLENKMQNKVTIECVKK